MPTKEKPRIKVPAPSVPYRYTLHGDKAEANGRESIEDHPQRFTDVEDGKPSLALSGAAIEASQARVRDIVRRIQAGEQIEQDASIEGGSDFQHLRAKVDLSSGKVADLKDVPLFKSAKIDQALAEKARKPKPSTQPRDHGRFTSHAKIAREKSAYQATHAALREESWASAGKWLAITGTKFLWIVCLSFAGFVIAGFAVTTFFEIVKYSLHPVEFVVHYLAAVAAEWVVR